DGNFILGEAPELHGFFVCAGFNSAGIANAGGAGKLIAQWIVDGEAPLDLWDVDIRRFAAFHANRSHLFDRTAESLGLHYAMRWRCCNGCAPTRSMCRSEGWCTPRCLTSVADSKATSPSPVLARIRFSS